MLERKEKDDETQAHPMNAIRRSSPNLSAPRCKVEIKVKQHQIFRLGLLMSTLSASISQQTEGNGLKLHDVCLVCP